MSAIVNAFKREFGAAWLIMMVGFASWCALGGVASVLVILFVCFK
jgi:hypothetical protein